MHLSPQGGFDWRHIAMSILIGACVAFVSSILDGLRAFLTEPGVHLAGSGSSMLWYFLRLRA